ncbi:hypothetical protein AGMMS49545_07060 [Betaproteobacteria bacterium]|nr:hypothetical protein AGMMS49545_07060 [Betaproteobacteria bacterium]GHU45107.1 hypothetical protein AGMMS50289_15470 [Betaproteobacteria bacterium]
MHVIRYQGAGIRDQDGAQRIMREMARMFGNAQQPAWERRRPAGGFSSARKILKPPAGTPALPATSKARSDAAIHVAHGRKNE